MTIYESIIAVMQEVGAIGKDKHNQQQNFKFRGIDDVYNHIQPILSKHGIFTVPEVLEERHSERVTAKGSVIVFAILKIRYTFFSSDGSSVSCVVVGEAMDMGDKASNKAMSIAHKYALLQTFAIPTEEMDDPDSEAHEMKQQGAVAKGETINGYLASKGIKGKQASAFCTKHGITSADIAQEWLGDKQRLNDAIAQFAKLP